MVRHPPFVPCHHHQTAADTRPRHALIPGDTCGAGKIQGKIKEKQDKLEKLRTQLQLAREAGAQDEVEACERSVATLNTKLADLQGQLRRLSADTSKLADTSQSSMGAPVVLKVTETAEALRKELGLPLPLHPANETERSVRKELGLPLPLPLFLLLVAAF